MENKLIKLLDIAYHHFLDKEMQNKMDIIFQKGWGMEGWFQNELIAAWNRSGFEASTKNKLDHDADIVVDDIGIELKCWKRKYPNKRRLVNAPKSHPDADAYMFLSENVKSMLDDLNETLNIEYNILIKNINSNLVLILMYKKNK